MNTRSVTLASLGFLAVLLVGGLAASPAAAAVGDVEITPQIAYRFAGEIDGDGDFEIVDFGDGFDIEDGEAYGVLVGIPLAPEAVPGLRLELFANRQETEISRDRGLFLPPDALVDFDVTYLQAGVAYEWGLGHVRPFVAGSLGGARLDLDLPGTESEDRFAGSLGGGVKVELAEHLSLRLESRGYWVYLGNDDHDRDDCRFRERDCYDRYDDDGSLYQLDVSIGLAFEF